MDISQQADNLRREVNKVQAERDKDKKELTQVESALIEQNQKVEELKRRKEEAEVKHKNLSEEIARLTKELNDVRKTILPTEERKRTNLIEQKNMLEGEIFELNRTLESSNQKLEEHLKEQGK